MIFSNILENDINSEIGLKFDMSSLSPDLLIGIIVEYFSLEGKVPLCMDLLIM